MPEQGFFSHSTAVLDAGCKIGKGTSIWHFSHIMPGASIGENCIIGQNVFIGNKVMLGNQVKVQNNVSVYEGVICEDEVFIGPSVVFTNVINPRSRIDRKHQFRQTVIKKGATIGANATIICGNEMGEYAFVAAGSVVTKSVLPYALVMGNPAKQKGWVSEAGCKLEFDEEGNAVCKESRQRYELRGGLVSRV